MKLTRQFNFSEWATLDQIKKDLQRYVAKKLAAKKQPVDITNQIGVNTTQTIEQVLFKTKDKL
tara:strand:- start:1566 stop:1754 length:189 start_codon:yes stop_codon:yes gene_type:complete